MSTVATDTKPTELSTKQEQELLQRITRNPGIFGGKPIIRGMRFAVEHVLGQLSAGMSVDELLEDNDILEREDIQACLLFAKQQMATQEIRSAASTRESG